MIIKTTELKRSFEVGSETVEAIKGINLEVQAGEFLAITGPSGSGKTTLMNIIGCLDTPTSGEYFLNNKLVNELNENELAGIRNKEIGFVFQSFHLLPGLTALENVALPLELNGDGKALETANYYLERVGLSSRTTHYPRQLSGGEQQRVAVARAFACKPTILFADEPTGNLDTGTGEIINDLLFDLNREEGTTLILVTHEMNLAARCNLTLQLQAGRQMENDEAKSKELIS